MTAKREAGGDLRASGPDRGRSEHPGGGLGQPQEDQAGPAGILEKLALTSFPFLFLLLLLVLEWWIRGRS
jgi:hypothetical protein